MLKTKAVLALTMAAMTLGGCQLFSPGHDSSFRSAQVAPDMSSYFDQRLADGRRHLRAGRISKAITAYRQASYSRDHAAQAYNGLAISYDRLGRRDLASQYFQAALVFDPENEAIARNLARFEGRNPGMDPSELPALASIHGMPTTADIDQDALMAAAREPDQLQRIVQVTNGELHIRSRDDWSSRLASAESERAAVLHVGPAPRAAVAERSRDADYPQRVMIQSASEEARARILVRRGPPNGRNYPVRVALPQG